MDALDQILQFSVSFDCQPTVTGECYHQAEVTFADNKRFPVKTSDILGLFLALNESSPNKIKYHNVPTEVALDQQLLKVHYPQYFKNHLLTEIFLRTRGVALSKESEESSSPMVALDERSFTYNPRFRAEYEDENTGEHTITHTHSITVISKHYGPVPSER